MRDTGLSVGRAAVVVVVIALMLYTSHRFLGMQWLSAPFINMFYRMQMLLGV
jgi:hypothetical protein